MSQHFPFLEVKFYQCSFLVGVARNGNQESDSVYPWFSVCTGAVSGTGPPLSALNAVWLGQHFPYLPPPHVLQTSQPFSRNHLFSIIFTRKLGQWLSMCKLKVPEIPQDPYREPLRSKVFLDDVKILFPFFTFILWSMQWSFPKSYMTGNIATHWMQKKT